MCTHLEMKPPSSLHSLVKFCLPHQIVMPFLSGAPTPEKILYPPVQCRCKSPVYYSDVKCSSRPIVSVMGSNPDLEFNYALGSTVLTLCALR